MDFTRRRPRPRPRARTMNGVTAPFTSRQGGPKEEDFFPVAPAGTGPGDFAGILVDLMKRYRVQAVIDRKHQRVAYSSREQDGMGEFLEHVLHAVLMAIGRWALDSYEEMVSATPAPSDAPSDAVPEAAPCSTRAERRRRPPRSSDPED